MIIALSVSSVIALGIIAGSIQLAKSLGTIRNMITARQQVSTFSNAVMSFAAQSYGVYFRNQDGDEMDYHSEHPWSDDDMDVVYFLKDESAGTEARLYYNESEQRFEWWNGSDYDVILEGAHRMDFTGTNTGNEPVFRFPHDLNVLWDPDNNDSRPKFMILEFRKEVMPPSAQYPDGITIPMTLIVEVNTIN
jgi:hypothetical protein